MFFISRYKQQDIKIMALRLKGLHLYASQIRRASTKSSSNIFDSQKDYVVTANNGRTVVCWHPEKEFPYECSRPLPENQIKPHPHLSIDPQVVQIFHQRTENSVIQNLMKVTYTDKYKWYPVSRIQRAKKTRPDREYL